MISWWNAVMDSSAQRSVPIPFGLILKVYKMADIESRNSVERPQPFNQIISSAVFAAPHAPVSDISLQSANVDLATFAQDWEPIIEEDANLGCWGYEDIDHIEREEDYGI
jgi:hypothetical protein